MHMVDSTGLQDLKVFSDRNSGCLGLAEFALLALLVDSLERPRNYNNYNREHPFQRLGPNASHMVGLSGLASLLRTCGRLKSEEFGKLSPRGLRVNRTLLRKNQISTLVVLVREFGKISFLIIL